MLLFLKKSQFLCGVIAVCLVFAPFTSLKAQKKEPLLQKKIEEQQAAFQKQNDELLKNQKELQNQYLWYSHYSRGSELLIQQELKKELSNNQGFMNTIKGFIDALKMGYQDYKSNKLIQKLNSDFIFNEKLDSMDAGVSVKQHSNIWIYPQKLIWSHRKDDDDIVVGDTLARRLFGNYANKVLRHYANTGTKNGNPNFVSDFLYLSDSSSYRAEITLAAFKKDVSYEKSQEFIVRYPAYTNDVKAVYSNNYIMTSRQWWKDIRDDERRSDFEWRDSTDNNTKFSVGLSRPFISSTGENSLTERSLWFDIELEDDPNAKIIFTVLLTKNEPPFAKTIVEPPPPIKRDKQVELVKREVSLHKQKKLALIIGNTDYTNFERLYSPSKDVDSMSNVFFKLGFDTMRYKNLDYESFQQIFQKFSSRADIGDYEVILFYYAGHGAWVDKYNYIVPTNFPRISSRTAFVYKAFNVEELLGSLSENDSKKSFPKTYITILDACRENLAAQIGKSSSNIWLRKEPEVTNSLIVYSASQLHYAYEGKDNSCFTSVLLKYIKNCGSISEIMDTVSGEVSAKCSQTPVKNSTLLGRFYLKEPCKN